VNLNVAQWLRHVAEVVELTNAANLLQLILRKKQNKFVSKYFNIDNNIKIYKRLPYDKAQTRTILITHCFSDI
jgi:MinD superfamily P-loop ATPase